MVGDVVDGAPQWDFSDWPRGIVGQIGGQDADPQLSLWKKHTQRHTHALKTKKEKETKEKTKKAGLHESKLNLISGFLRLSHKN